MADTITELLLEKNAAANPFLNGANMGLAQRKALQAGIQARNLGSTTGKKVGLAVGGAAALGGGALLAAKLMKRKSLAKRMMGAMKRNKGRIGAAALGAGALGAGGYAYSRR